MLIDSARGKCDSLAVILYWEQNEQPSGKQRAHWLRELYPDIHVFDLENNFDLQVEFLPRNFPVPDVIFTLYSRNIKPFRKFVRTNYELIDTTQFNPMVSGRSIRKNPYQHLNFLNPIVSSYYSKVVCIIGAESTGKTILSQRLSSYFHGSRAIPEFARELCNKLIEKRRKLEIGKDFKVPKWIEEDFVEIAQEQTYQIDQACLHSPLVISDTNVDCTKIWQERYLGKVSDTVQDIANHARKVDLYLFCESSDVPFVQDGTRDGQAAMRAWMNQRFLETFENKSNVVILKGDYENRYLDAIKAVKTQFPDLMQYFGM